MKRYIYKISKWEVNDEGMSKQVGHAYLNDYDLHHIAMSVKIDLKEHGFYEKPVADTMEKIINTLSNLGGSK